MCGCGADLTECLCGDRCCPVCGCTSVWLDDPPCMGCGSDDCDGYPLCHVPEEDPVSLKSDRARYDQSAGAGHTEDLWGIAVPLPHGRFGETYIPAESRDHAERMARRWSGAARVEQWPHSPEMHAAMFRGLSALFGGPLT